MNIFFWIHFYIYFIENLLYWIELFYIPLLQKKIYMNWFQFELHTCILWIVIISYPKSNGNLITLIYLTSVMPIRDSLQWYSIHDSWHYSRIMTKITYKITFFFSKKIEISRKRSDQILIDPFSIKSVLFQKNKRPTLGTW